MNTAEALTAEDDALVSSGSSSVDNQTDSCGSSAPYFVRLARAAALVLLSVGVHIWIDGRRPGPHSTQPAGDLLLSSSPVRISGAPGLHPLASTPAGNAAPAAAATDIAAGDSADAGAVAKTGRFPNDTASVPRPVAVSTAPEIAVADSSRSLGPGTMRSALPDLARTDHAVIPTARLAVWTGSDDALPPVSVPELGPAHVEHATNVPELTRGNGAVTPAAARVGATAPDEEASILQVLRRYERAVVQNDPLGAKAVWPSLDDRALARAFNDLQSHSLALQDCGVTIDSVGARATCQGVATYLPKVGRRKPISASHEWTFNLAKQGGGWHIESAAIQ
jgi:hypothetical protein